MIPPKRLTDPTFEYTRSDFTDIRQTFARVRQQMQSEQPKPEQQPTEKGHDNGN